MRERHREIPLALVGAVLLSMLLASCFKSPYYRADGNRGSCSGACDHYLSCKGTDDRHAEDACMRECNAIFVEDGEVDRASLKDFEDLDCTEVISFVEGESGHALGDDDRHAASQ